MNQIKKVCKICNTEQYIFSKGRCKTCSNKQGAPLLRTTISKRVYRIPVQTEKNKLYRKSQSAIRDVYFEHHIDLCKISEESGVKIINPTRVNICHLFDKGRHKSLQGNLDNYVYLTWEEHTLFDDLLYTHNFTALEKSFPKSWSKSCERMKKLLSLCEEKTKFYFEIEKYLKN